MHFRSWLLASLLCCGVACPALAQDGTAPKPPPDPHHGPSGKDAAQSSALDLQARYSFDVWHSASGGLARGTRYLDNLDLQATLDLDRAIGWRGATAYGYALYNNGRSISALTGDAQTISNIETNIEAIRLYEAWVEQDFGSVSVKLGLYDINSEFDALAASALFLNSAHGVGTDIGQTGVNGPSIFPVLSLGARIDAEIAPGITLRAALVDGVPGDPARPRRTAIRLGDGDGAFAIAEAEVALRDGKLLLGHWRYTAEFDAISGGRGRGNAGVYLRGEAHLSHERDGEQGLSGFFRLGTAASAFNAFGSFVSAGLVYTGAVFGRDRDQLDLAIAAAFVSADSDRAARSEAAETAIELTYSAALTDWLSVQPSVQYIIDPSADPTTHDALVLGVRTQLSLPF